jgi:hypothetical protein
VPAVLDPNLLADALVGVVDTIRRDIHGELGTRPWRVSFVRRTWSGGVVGEGNPTDSIEVLDPDPEVVFADGGSNRMSPGGVESTNKVTLYGVSLRYTMEEIYPSVLPPGVEFVYMLERQFGQAFGATEPQREFFTVTSTPVPRRGDKRNDASDWKIGLSEVEGFSLYNGSDA